MRGNGGREYDWMFGLILLAGAGIYVGEKIVAGQFVELALSITIFGVVLGTIALLMQYMAGSSA